MSKVGKWGKKAFRGVGGKNTLGQIGTAAALAAGGYMLAPAIGGAAAAGTTGTGLGSLMPSLLGAGATLGAGYMGMKGQQSANEAGLASAREQMVFQERMSGSAHQREVADLKAAGLNPILSAGGGGASSPGGASFSPENEAAPLAGAVQSAISSALDMRRLKKDIEEASSRIRLNDQQTTTQGSLRLLQDAQTSAARAMAGKNEAESETAKNKAAVERKYPRLFGTIDALSERTPSGLSMLIGGALGRGFMRYPAKPNFRQQGPIRFNVRDKR